MSEEQNQPQPEQPPQPLNRRHLIVWVSVAVVLVLALVGFAIWSRIQKNRRASEDLKSRQKVTVNIIQVTRENKAEDLVLPGDIQAFEEATLYARTDGYIKSWFVDIGDNVKAGQPLAEIETPEVDQQLDQARASLNQASANLDLAKTSAARYGDAVKSHAVSAQANDEQQSGYVARQADFAASQANVGRLQKLQSFEHIVAPFDGTITSRRIDVGSLISAGSTVLFTLEQTDPLRIYINVPQSNVPALHEGLPVKILVAERPGRDFEGKVVRLAGAIAPATRTMQIEVQIPNHDHALYAGMYAQMKFSLLSPQPPVIIPTSAFVFKPQGPQVATITNENRVHWQAIQIGLDYGTQMEVVAGLRENTSVIINPNDGLDEGMQVEAKPANLSGKNDGNQSHSGEK